MAHTCECEFGNCIGCKGAFVGGATLRRVQELEHRLAEEIGNQVDHAMMIERVETTELIDLIYECVKDWRERAAAEEYCQRSGGNPKGALAYNHCANDLEASLKEWQAKR